MLIKGILKSARSPFFLYTFKQKKETHARGLLTSLTCAGLSLALRAKNTQWDTSFVTLLRHARVPREENCLGNGQSV